jgi:hypothetical protein
LQGTRGAIPQHILTSISGIGQEKAQILVTLGPSETHNAEVAVVCISHFLTRCHIIKRQTDLKHAIVIIALFGVITRIISGGDKNAGAERSIFKPGSRSYITFITSGGWGIT